ncbi:unnamed protein product [Brassica oleracea]
MILTARLDPDGDEEHDHAVDCVEGSSDLERAGD